MIQLACGVRILSAWIASICHDFPRSLVACARRPTDSIAFGFLSTRIDPRYILAQQLIGGRQSKSAQRHSFGISGLFTFVELESLL